MFTAQGSSNFQNLLKSNGRTANKRSSGSWLKVVKTENLRVDWSFWVSILKTSFVWDDSKRERNRETERGGGDNEIERKKSEHVGKKTPFRDKWFSSKPNKRTDVGRSSFNTAVFEVRTYVRKANAVSRWLQAPSPENTCWVSTQHHPSALVKQNPSRELTLSCEFFARAHTHRGVRGHRLAGVRATCIN